MSERHLQKGSTLPAVKPDLMRIYSMRYCPFAERTRLVLDHKGIPYETVNINLMNKPEWLFERNPAGLVPVLEYKGHYISESAICDEFLEDAFPNAGPHPLLPSCPFERAAARLFMQRFDKKKNIIVLLKSRAKDAANFQKDFDNHLSDIQNLENYLASRGEKFFSANFLVVYVVTTDTVRRFSNPWETIWTHPATEGQTCSAVYAYGAGKQVGMIDFHLWPFFERIPAICELIGADIYPADKYPQLAKWIDAMEQTDAVKKARVTNEIHKLYMISTVAGSPRYDLEVDSTSKTGPAKL